MAQSVTPLRTTPRGSHACPSFPFLLMKLRSPTIFCAWGRRMSEEVPLDAEASRSQERPWLWLLPSAAPNLSPGHPTCCQPDDHAQRHLGTLLLERAPGGTERTGALREELEAGRKMLLPVPTTWAAQWVQTWVSLNLETSCLEVYSTLEDGSGGGARSGGQQRTMPQGLFQQVVQAPLPPHPP